MATPNADMGELITAALKMRRKAIADAVTKNCALYMRMRTRKHLETTDGGEVLTSPIDFIENPNFMYYDGYGRLAVSGQPVIDSCQVSWKQWAVGVTVSGTEMLKASGQHQVFNILAARTKNARRTLSNKLSEGVYSDGTGSSGLEITGTQAWISDSAGGTVGNIDSSSYPFWDNQRSTGVSFSTSTAYDEMLELYLACSRNNDQPDLIVSDNSFFKTFSASLQAQQRFMDREMAEAGFRNNLLFMNAPVVFDGGLGGQAPAGMYFINSDTMKFIIHKKRNNVVLNGPERALDQDATTKIVAGMGNVLCTNRQLNGRLTGTIA